MGKAKDYLIEAQQDAAVAKALGISVEALQGFGYDVLEDLDRQGNVIRTFVVWDDECPEGVALDAGQGNESTIILDDDQRDEDEA